MLFNSYIFLFGFLPAAFGLFFLLGRFQWHRAALASLVVSSLVFYAYWNPPFVLLLLFSNDLPQVHTAEDSGKSDGPD